MRGRLSLAGWLVVIVLETMTREKKELFEVTRGEIKFVDARVWGPGSPEFQVALMFLSLNGFGLSSKGDELLWKRARTNTHLCVCVCICL